MQDFISQVLSHPKSWHDAFIIAGKTAVVYVFLVGGLRLLGKRELGQMTVYDLVLMIVLANSVQNAMVGEDSTLLGGIVSATTLIILNLVLVRTLSRSKKLEQLLVGQPVVLAALHEHGMERPEEAHLAILEVDGSISVVPNNSTVHRTRRHYRALRLN